MAWYDEKCGIHNSSGRTLPLLPHQHICGWYQERLSRRRSCENRKHFKLYSEWYRQWHCLSYELTWKLCAGILESGIGKTSRTERMGLKQVIWDFELNQHNSLEKVRSLRWHLEHPKENFWRDCWVLQPSHQRRKLGIRDCGAWDRDWSRNWRTG